MKRSKGDMDGVHRWKKPISDSVSPSLVIFHHLQLSQSRSFQDHTGISVFRSTWLLICLYQKKKKKGTHINCITCGCTTIDLQTCHSSFIINYMISNSSSRIPIATCRYWERRGGIWFPSSVSPFVVVCLPLGLSPFYWCFRLTSFLPIQIKWLNDESQVENPSGSRWSWKGTKYLSLFFLSLLMMTTKMWEERERLFYWWISKQKLSYTQAIAPTIHPDPFFFVFQFHIFFDKWVRRSVVYIVLWLVHMDQRSWLYYRIGKVYNIDWQMTIVVNQIWHVIFLYF